MARLYGPPSLMQNHVIPLLKYWQTSKRTLALPVWRRFRWTIAYDLSPGWQSAVTSSDAAVLQVTGPIVGAPAHTYDIKPISPGVCTLTIGIQLDDGSPTFPISVSIQIEVD